MVVGYDVGDPFYDSKQGQDEVHAWFKVRCATLANRKKGLQWFRVACESGYVCVPD